jgi:hypothetical protein
MMGANLAALASLSRSPAFDFFFHRRFSKAAAATSPINARTPITMPAIAPPERLLWWGSLLIGTLLDVGLSLDIGLLLGVAVEVGLGLLEVERLCEAASIWNQFVMVV